MSDQPDSVTFDAYLIRYPDGSWLAQLADLPGAYARGVSQDEAMTRLTGAIPPYYAWLTRHDDYTPILRGSPRVTARQVVAASADGAVFFDGDAEPVSDEDLDWWLAALDWTYSDVVAAAQTAAGAANSRMLSAVAAAQMRILFLATGAAPVDVAALSPEPLAQVEQARKRSLAEFRRTKPDQRAATHEAQGQRWSVRRGLRESALLARQALDHLSALTA